MIRIVASGSRFASFIFLSVVMIPVLRADAGKISTIFAPTWESLSLYECPEWYRDAKLGFWAHWGAQCEPEYGDWYARNMYADAGDKYLPYPAKYDQYHHHLDNYGHPSEAGFKDIIHQWKAANFDPDKLLAFYKESGARYFTALANHHDNFDNWDSKHQPWNAVAIGPKKDLIGLWAAAARKQGLRFGVSVHASHAWSWYETAQGTDKEGPHSGVTYDGKLTKADGVGQWWDGLDPQELYAQNHVPGRSFVWDWDPTKGSSIPDRKYMEKYYRRTQQLMDDYQPDLIYFDDNVLPFHGVTDEIGLRLAAHAYNTSIARHGRNEAVVNTKRLNEEQRKALVYDIERGKAEGILERPWQTDTCIGQWHYDRQVFYRKEYKDAATVISMLADIVSKNGNLMLNIPLRRDGTLDHRAEAIVRGIGAWMRANGEAIYATRPWRIYGEGPSTLRIEKSKHGGQADTSTVPYSPADMRFTRSKDGGAIYAIVLAWPSTGSVTIKSLAATIAPEVIESVMIVAGESPVKWSRDAAGLHVSIPGSIPTDHTLALRISVKHGQ